MIKGITITLWTKTETGRDVFNHPIEELTSETISDVLVAPASTEDLPANIDLETAKSLYTMALPKGDAHDWHAVDHVEFLGHSWKIIGYELEGIEDNIPLRWNRKVTVARYE
jgi:hypothetical protein